jgi:hypothetical protein
VIFKKIAALNLWLSQDWHGNMPEHGPLSGSLKLEAWQLRIFAYMLLGIAAFVYIALAASGVITWLPF